VTQISVLVASADAERRSWATLALSSERFTIVEAKDTDTAVVLLASRLPALLVLDLDLPGTGALALARSARSQPETSGSRTVLLATRGAALPDEVPGVDAVVTLPSSPFTLLRKVDEALAS
jgi:two-component system, OmpR family, response regulator